ncbi:MAG: hypothetical protein WDA25_11025 [Paracoccaceae bacterium]
MTTNHQMEAMLSAWGRADLADLSANRDRAGDSARIARIIQHAHRVSTSRQQPAHPDTSRSHRSWWWVGGSSIGVAASVAVALLLAGNPMTRPATPTAAPTLLADDDSDDMMLFALLYTPTSEEEYQL